MIKPNLKALAQWSLDTAEAIAAATPTPLDWPDDAELQRRTDEFVADIEWLPTFALVVMGFGHGWHVREALRRMDAPNQYRRRSVFTRKGSSLWYCPVIVYEPDMGRVRAVMERLDMSAELARVPMHVVTTNDASSIYAVVRMHQTMVAMGTYIADYAPDAERLGDGRISFVRHLYAAGDAAGIMVNTMLVLG